MPSNDPRTGIASTYPHLPSNCPVNTNGLPSPRDDNDDQPQTRQHQVDLALEREAAADHVRRAFAKDPAGRFVRTGLELGLLLAKKNAAYGSSFEKGGEILALLYPNGIHPDQMPDALAIIRIVGKLLRIATHRDAFGESPARDIAGYAILLALTHEQQPTAD